MDIDMKIIDIFMVPRGAEFVENKKKRQFIFCYRAGDYRVQVHKILGKSDGRELSPTKLWRL